MAIDAREAVELSNKITVAIELLSCALVKAELAPGSLLRANDVQTARGNLAVILCEMFGAIMAP